VIACEWDENTLIVLRRTLMANDIDESRFRIFAGDNSKAGLEGIADRGFLGLIPSSENDWPVAIRALKSSGGYLHIHGNAKNGQEQEWAERVIRSLQELAAVEK
jgi:tRNA wybutosine-synthesizing protein 3